MTARTVIEHALRAYYVDSAEPNAIARDLLTQHEAEVRRADADLIEQAACDADYTEDPRFIAGLRTAVELLTRKAGEKSSRPAADATPDSARERRLAQLLDTIRTHRGTWGPKRVQDLRRFTGGPTQRGTARRDLEELSRRGHLDEFGPDDGRFFTLKVRKGGA
ncbi:hypothetical protein [Streptomyces sp. NPDC001658]